MDYRAGLPVPDYDIAWSGLRLLSCQTSSHGEASRDGQL